MFEDKLRKGQIGESVVAGWLKSKGLNILPVYDVPKNSHAGPAVFTANQGNIIAPDILAFNRERILWVEVKTKTGFSLHRKSNRMVAGIDIHHYNQYKLITGLVDWDVLLLFLILGGTAKDSPQSEPGLFGNTFNELIWHENHRSDKWGPSGMVYWHVDDLKKLANIEELEKFGDIRL